MKTSTTKLYNWALLKANSTGAPWWIALLFGLELFLFIPLDAILIFFCLQNPKRTFLYVLIAAVASTLSAILGYMIGHFLWDLIGSYIVPHLISTSFFERVSSHLQLYENWAVFLGALLPLPMKAISLTSGVFHLAFLPFFCCVLAARLLRFGLVGGAMVLWGESVKTFVDRHFHRIILLVGAKLAAALILFWAIAR
jgi:membrane protein YqaA with SNARE-associated domain